MQALADSALQIGKTSQLSMRNMIASERNGWTFRSKKLLTAPDHQEPHVGA